VKSRLAVLVRADQRRVDDVLAEERDLHGSLLALLAEQRTGQLFTSRTIDRSRTTVLTH